MTRHRRTLLPVCILSFVPSGLTWASDPEKPKDDNTPALKRQIPGVETTIEGICNQAAGNIAKRYNLNEAQAAETRKLMKREVEKFIRAHESEIWPLIRSLLASQMGANPPEDPEELMRLGKGARPLVQLAKEAIFRANDEWRKYLTEEQKRVHDFDLAEMEKTFEVIDKNFSAWAEGRPRKNPLFPPADKIPEGSPPRPRRPEGGLPEPVIDHFIKPTIFETFVEEFIKDNNLDQGQIDSARSILNEFKHKAVTVNLARRTDLSKVAAEEAEAIKRRDQKKIAELKDRREKLLQPIYELFALMEGRLKGLLSSSQLELYEARQKAVALEPRKKAPAPDKVKQKKNTSEPMKATADSKKPAAAPVRKQ